MTRTVKKRAHQGFIKLWASIAISLLLLLPCLGASAENKLVSVSSVIVPQEASQYSKIVVEAMMSYDGAPAGTVEFAVKKPGASAYTVLDTRPVAANVALYYDTGLSELGAYTARIRYVPAGGESDFIAGTEQYQTINVRGAKTSSELVDALQSASGARTVVMDGDITLTRSVTINRNITLIGGHILSRGNANVQLQIDTGSLTLQNTVIDGKNIQSNMPLIDTSGGGRLTLSEGARIANVKSSADGGVVCGKSGSAQITLEQNALIENCATTGKGTIYIDGRNAALTMTDSARISSCQAADGGAVYLTNSIAVLDGSATITGCTATGFGGGIAAVNRSQITLSDDATVTGCSATSGGGISADNTTLSLNNRAAIKDNTASRMGGGAYLKSTGSVLTMKGSAGITGNKTTADQSAFLGGGGVRLEAGAQAELSGNATVSGNIANYDGGGFNIDDRAVLTLRENASVTGNQAKTGNGGGVNVDNGATLTLTGSATISNNTAKQNGGGVDLDGVLKNDTPSPSKTTATLSDYASITGNSCEKKGGGIIVYKYCTLTLGDNAVISNNSATDGGGVYVEGVVIEGQITYDQTIVNMAGSSAISNNTATNHGGGVVLYYGTLNQQGGAIANNKAARRGGGVYIKPACSIVTMAGTSMIADNEAGDDGGGVAVDSVGCGDFVGSLTMTDNAAILGNKAAQSGGGIFLTLNGNSNCDAFDVTMSGHASISGNEAGYGSGGYENASKYYGLVYDKNLRISHLYLSGSANLSGNVKADFYFGELLKSDNAYILINGRYTGSCGIYYATTNDTFLDAAIAYWEGYTPANDDIASYEAYCFYNNNDIDGHFEKRNGWKYDISGNTTTRKNVYLMQSGAQRRVSEYYSSSNTALASYTYNTWRANIKNCFDKFISSTSYQYLWMQVNSPETVGETMKIPSGKVLTITGAQITRAAGFKGSMFQVLPGGTLILDGVRLDGGGTSGCSPLVVVEDGSTLTLRNGATLANNVSASAGGAIYGKDDAGTSATSSIYILPGAVITNNQNTNGTGGGVYSAGIVGMTGGTVSKNSARDGGGIYTTGRLTMSGGSVAGNTASASGGGVYFKGEGTITGGIIEKNAAAGNIGGGVCVAGTGSLTMSGGQVRGNTANTNGGGIASDANITVSGGVISGNKAVTGGGICVQNGQTANLSGSALITDNEATGNGGGVAGGGVTLQGSARVAHNRAAGNGGGVYADGSAGLSGNAVIDGNTAHSGGGVYFAKGSGTMWYAGGTISGNTATGDGGGIYLQGKSGMDSQQILIVSCKISGNTAAGTGGGLYVGDNLAVRISSLTLSENKAESGAGMRVGSSTVELIENQVTHTGAVVAANIATTSGAGILINGGTVTIEKATISGNTAEYAGGGIHNIYGNVTIKGGTQLTGNRAMLYGGGAYLQTGTTTIEDAIIQKNTAKSGGGVEYASGSLTLGAAVSIDQNDSFDGGMSNLHLGSGQLISLTSAAMTGKIGVTPTGASYPMQITQGVTATQQTANAFTDDTEQHATGLSGGNVVFGAVSPVVRVEISGVDTAEFGSLPEAFAFANSNASLTKPATITLLRDAEVSDALTLNAGVAATLTGYSIKRSAAYASKSGLNCILYNRGTMTLGAITLEGAPGNGNSPLVINENMCALTIDGAVLQNNVCVAGAVCNYGLCEMLSGTITGCSSGMQGDLYASAIWNVCNLILTGGSITGNAGTSACVRSYDTLSGVKALITLGSTVITNNGAGVKHNGTGGFMVKGQPVVADNTAYNVYLPDNMVMTASGALGNQTRIGVTTQSLPVFRATQPADKTEIPIINAPMTYASNIVPDNPLYSMEGRSDGTIYLVVGNRDIPAPTANQVTNNSVTLNPVVPSVSGAGDVIEYGYTTVLGQDPSDSVWQTSVSFTGLTSNTTYYFMARVTQGTQYKDQYSPLSAGIVTESSYTVTLTKPSIGVERFETSPTGADGSWTAYTDGTQVAVNPGGSLYIKANLTTGYRFEKWADGLTDNPYQLTDIQENKAFTPTVALKTYTVTLTKPAAGVTGFETSPDGADGSWTAYADGTPVVVNHGDDLYIKANLVTGYTFVKWADGITANPLKLESIIENKAFTPTVSLDTYTVTLTKPAAGVTGFETSPTGADGSWTTYADGTPVVVNHGTDLYIKANLVTGYTLVKWADGITANPQKLESIIENKAFTPTVSLDVYTVTLTKPAAGVTGFETSPDGADGSWTAYSTPVVVAHGDDLYIKANLQNGYAFEQWASGITQNPALLGGITQDHSYAPSVTLATYTVTYDDDGATTAHVGGDTSYTVLVTSFALPTAPKKTVNSVVYTFTGWKVTSGAAGGTGFQAGDTLTGASRALAGSYGSVTLTAQWSTVPVITVQPTDQSVLEGGSATFSITATGVPAPTYQWQTLTGGVWTDIAGATNAIYTVSSATKSMSGSSYRCLVSNQYQSNVPSDAVTLTVGHRPIDPPASDNLVTGITAGQQFTQGDQVGFTAVGGGMDNQRPVAGDLRWLPISWQTNPSGDFASGYTQVFQTGKMTAGTHTLTVTFQKQRYTGAAWENISPETKDTKSVQYLLKKAPVPPVTGDGGEPALWAALCLLALIGMTAVGRKKRRA